MILEAYVLNVCHRASAALRLRVLGFTGLSMEFYLQLRLITLKGFKAKPAKPYMECSLEGTGLEPSDVLSVESYRVYLIPAAWICENTREVLSAWEALLR